MPKPQRDRSMVPFSTPYRGHDMTIQRIETGPRMSKVVIHSDTVYLAGLTANKTLAAGVAE